MDFCCALFFACQFKMNKCSFGPNKLAKFFFAIFGQNQQMNKAAEKMFKMFLEKLKKTKIGKQQKCVAFSLYFHCGTFCKVFDGKNRQAVCEK